jgi:uncharacterized RDD family membrane protein YckC
MMEQQSLLTELEFNPVLASPGKRFLNYLVDMIVYYVIMFVLGIALALTQSSLIYENRIWINVLAFIILLVYYFVCEAFLNGRTIGKFVTGTKAVNEDGTEITTKTALLRTLCRLVPFEPFSAFGGHPWHDKWTKTYVIDVKKTGLNDLLVQA